MLGKLKQLKQEMVAQVHLLGELALMGQADGLLRRDERRKDAVDAMAAD